ncbi:MAG: YabP/YqfC family sporulation protein [Clostridiaceae bacterium]|nr:YabP/YqfC family sporulation protein [Clostridiaceae bacterium]
MVTKPETAEKRPQNLTMTDRAHISLTGILEVKRFDEREIVLATTRGRLTIQGDALKITRFSEESGELGIDGRIDALGYSGERGESGGFWTRLFG